MKKLILLSFIALVSFSACKKDKAKKSTQSMEAAIHGEWFTTSEHFDFYNSAGVKVYETNATPGSEYVINTSILRMDPSKVRNLYTAYTLTKVNGKDFISFADKGAVQTFEIVSVDKETMSWRQEKADQTYTDNTGTHVAAKQVYTINFHCPCK